MENKEKKEIITADSLREYFFDGLEKLNNKSLSPLPQEILGYSSEVLEKYSTTDRFYLEEDGRIKEKILGTKYLEAQKKSLIEQRRIYREIGDLSLMISGYFSSSVENKIVDSSFYKKLGQSAYLSLSAAASSFDKNDHPNLFKTMANCFDTLSYMLIALANQDLSDPNKQFFFDRVLEENFDDQQLSAFGIESFDKKKLKN